MSGILVFLWRVLPVNSTELNSRWDISFQKLVGNSFIMCDGSEFQGGLFRKETLTVVELVCWSEAGRFGCHTQAPWAWVVGLPPTGLEWRWDMWGGSVRGGENIRTGAQGEGRAKGGTLSPHGGFKTSFHFSVFRPDVVPVMREG